jgi:hypothetical protein
VPNVQLAPRRRVQVASRFAIRPRRVSPPRKHFQVMTSSITTAIGNRSSRARCATLIDRSRRPCGRPCAAPARTAPSVPAAVLQRVSPAGHRHRCTETDTNRVARRCRRDPVRRSPRPSRFRATRPPGTSCTSSTSVAIHVPADDSHTARPGAPDVVFSGWPMTPVSGDAAAMRSYPPTTPSASTSFRPSGCREPVPARPLGRNRDVICRRLAGIPCAFCGKTDVSPVDKRHRHRHRGPPACPPAWCFLQQIRG